MRHSSFCEIEIVPRLHAAAAEMTQTPKGEPWSTGTTGDWFREKDSSQMFKATAGTTGVSF